jgi:hypothetical protein
MMTAAITNDAVTGTASPSTSTATAASTTVASSTTVALSDSPPAKSTMIPDRLSPSPVSVVTPTMMPAAAVVAAIGSTLRAPSASAWKARRGPIRWLRSKKDSTNASRVA